MNKRVLTLGVGIIMGLATLAGAAVPSTADIQASAAEPMDFIKALDNASGVEIIQALEQVSKALPEVESSIGIENRIIGITAIGITMAKADAPAAAAATLNAIADEYKPLVAATAVLISGKKSKAVKRSLLSAISEDQREAVKSAADNPRKSVLNANQADVAAQYARIAVQNSFSSSALYFDLKDRSGKGASGNSSGFTRAGLTKLQEECFDSPQSMALLDLLSEGTLDQIQAELTTEGLGCPCARQRVDVLKLGLQENHPFWSDVGFIREMSCQSIAAIKHLDPNSLAAIRRDGKVGRDIAINKYKGQLRRNNSSLARGVGLLP